MIEKTILKFLKGEIDFNLFYNEYSNNEKIIQCLENIVLFLLEKNIYVTYDAVFRENYSAEEAEYYIQRNKKDHTEVVVPNRHFPTVKSLMDHFINSQCSFAKKKAEIYDLVFSIVKAFDPNILYLHKYSEDSEFFIEAVPSYIDGGEEVCGYIEKHIIEKLPLNITKAKRKKLCKEQIKQYFFVEGNKYPRWVQSAEWPLSKTGKPTKFLRQVSEGEVCFYYFLDMDTNEEIEVMQAY